MYFRVSALIAVLATPVFAASTDLQTFEKTVHKYAPPIDVGIGKLKKSPCVCQDDSVRHGDAGVLVHFGNASGGSPRLTCAIPSFDPATGEQDGVASCATFEYLGK